MITLRMLFRGNLDCPNSIHFTVNNHLYPIAIHGGLPGETYQSFQDFPEYAIVELLKYELKWGSNFLGALLSKLKLYKGDWKYLDSLVAIEMYNWKFSTLDHLNLILRTISLIDLQSLSPTQIKQFVIDQTGLDL